MHQTVTGMKQTIIAGFITVGAGDILMSYAALITPSFRVRVAAPLRVVYPSGTLAPSVSQRLTELKASHIGMNVSKDEKPG